ncbi:MAG: hypothetical protein M1839_004302 [Geoglossum umbratile]|nr:MAG: hypothetical protein M1839_004302 [Geoglossum umbratile]
MASRSPKESPEKTPKGASKLTDYVSRVKGPSPFGTALFTGLRLLDPLLQYAIMTRGLGSSLIRLCGAGTVPLAATTNVLGLAPYQTVMLSLAAGSTISETFWLLYISEQEMPAEQAVFIAAFNTAANSLSTLLSMCTVTSVMNQYGDWKSLLHCPPVVFGTALYVGGVLLQTVSEIQRKKFKENPANKGKPYGGGLFALASHINYGGFTIWRTGQAMVSAGWAFAAFSNAWFIYDFLTRAVPVLDGYCEQKYGAEYTQIVEKVPYKLIPGVI